MYGGFVRGNDTDETRGKNLGGDVRQWREREISGAAGRGERGKHLDGGRQERREVGQGVNEYDGTGRAFAECLRAVAAGLYAAAERVGERLRGIAEDARVYATEQRDAERAGHAVESAGTALERANRTLEPVIQRELAIRDERLEREYDSALERERQREIQEYTRNGPSLSR